MKLQKICKIVLEGFVYSRALNNTYGFSAAAIDDKLDSFQVFTGYHF